MSESITSYNFNVHVWEDGTTYNWLVAQEFECESKEFLPIGWGTADSYDDAITAAGEIARSVF